MIHIAKDATGGHTLCGWTRDRLQDFYINPHGADLAAWPSTWWASDTICTLCRRLWTTREEFHAIGREGTAGLAEPIDA